MPLLFALVVFLGSLFGGAYFIYDMGYKNGVQASALESSASTIKQLQSVVDDKDSEIARIKVERDKEQVDFSKFQETLDVIARRSGSFGAQINAALSNSGLAGCLYPDDVRRLRLQQSSETRQSVERANAAARRIQDGS